MCCCLHHQNFSCYSSFHFSSLMYIGSKFSIDVWYVCARMEAVWIGMGCFASYLWCCKPIFIIKYDEFLGAIICSFISLALQTCPCILSPLFHWSSMSVDIQANLLWNPFWVGTTKSWHNQCSRARKMFTSVNSNKNMKPQIGEWLVLHISSKLCNSWCKCCYHLSCGDICNATWYVLYVQMLLF